LTEELRSYREVGYVVIPDVFPAAELAAIDRESDRILARLLAERRERGEARGNGHHEESGSILQLGLRSEVCQRFAEDERILCRRATHGASRRTAPRAMGSAACR
jgi:hypothetical protein